MKGEVRIVGGVWKRTKIDVLDHAGLRPTPDRVRETLYNWLGQDLNGWRVLDAFAGSGALGFEAASRGAASVVLLETQPTLVRAMTALKQRLQANAVQLHVVDALAWMRRARADDAQRFELVLVDPPFGQGLQRKAAALAMPLLAPQAWLYVESDERLAPVEGVKEHRHARAGVVHAHLWQRED